MEQPDADRGRGLALIASAAASLLVSLTHPTGRDLAAASDHAAVLLRIQLVHGLAIAATAIGLLGSLGLRRRLLPAAPFTADFAAILFAVASGSAMLAAIAGGFLAPDLLERLHGDDAADRATAAAAALYNHLTQHAWSRLFALTAAGAIALWSLAGWRHRRLPRWLAGYGLGSSAALAALLTTGALTLDVHGLLLLVLAQAVWLVGAGAALCRPTSPPPTAA